MFHKENGLLESRTTRKSNPASGRGQVGSRAPGKRSSFTCFSFGSSVALKFLHLSQYLGALPQAVSLGEEALWSEVVVIATVL